MNRSKAGLTLVEAALLLCIAGIVLAVTVPTFVRKLETSKLEEVSVQLDALYRAASAYYRTPHDLPGGSARHCLPPAAGPAPKTPSPDPVEVDFTAADTPGAESWRALGFNPSARLRFRYTFDPAQAGCSPEPPTDGPMLVLKAEGDLDGDGEYSTFERSFVVDERGEMVPTKLLVVRDRTE
jgi:type II secretory pathway pseudopilin PulG